MKSRDYKFVPTRTLTLKEVTEILAKMGMQANQEAIDEMSPKLQEMFVRDSHRWDPDGEEE
jgi:hypothetical protein